jgi:hypothetical protein
LGALAGTQEAMRDLSGDPEQAAERMRRIMATHGIEG